MPRQFALLLCCAFSLFALRYDRKQRSGVSTASWLPTLWVLVIAGKSLDQWLGSSASTSGGKMDPIFHSALLCIGIAILFRRNFNWSAVLQQNIWLGLLVGFMILSIVWGDDRFVLFKRWIRELTGVVMAFLVISESNPQLAIQHILRRSVYILIPLSVVLVKYYQYMGAVYGRWTGEIQWIGVTLQKNGLGRLCVISAFYLIWTLVRRWQGKEKVIDRYQKYIDILMLLMVCWLLRGPSAWAASATALYSFGFGLIAYLFFIWAKKHRIPVGSQMWVTIIACIIGLGILTPLVGGATVSAFTSAVGRDSTLTGRTEIWAGLLPDVSRSPFLGYGFSSFWTDERAWAHEIREAHNGYLEVCLGLGIAGVFLTAAFLLSTARRAAAILRQDYDWATFTICFLIIATVHNITESSFDSFTKHLMAIVLFLSVSLSTRVRQVARKASAPAHIPNKIARNRELQSIGL